MYMKVPLTKIFVFYQFIFSNYSTLPWSGSRQIWNLFRKYWHEQTLYVTYSKLLFLRGGKNLQETHTDVGGHIKLSGAVQHQALLLRLVNFNKPGTSALINHE